MAAEQFRVGSVKMEALIEGSKVTYTARTNFGLCVSASTIGEIFQILSDAAKAAPALNDPFHFMEGVDGLAECLALASTEQMADLHAAHPVTGAEVGVTPRVLQDAFNSREGTALLHLLGAPASVRDVALESLSMSVTVEPGKSPGELQLVTLTRKLASGIESWLYSFSFAPLSLQFDDGVACIRAEVLARREWLEEQGIRSDVNNSGQDDRPPDSASENLVEKLPTSARVVGPPTQLAKLMEDYRTAAVDSFKKMSPNPNPDDKAESVAPLLAYLAGMIRFLVKNGLDRVPDSDLVCPWYVVGCSLASQYGLTNSGQLWSFGMTSIDEWDGLSTFTEPEGSHFVQRGSIPPGVN
jgi:hypothetical protein